MAASLPSARDDEGLDEHGPHVRAVGAGVGPHRAAHRARDGQAELQAGQAGLRGHGGRLGHGQPGVGHEALPLDALRLRAHQDHQPADAGVADDQVGAAAEEEEGDVAARAKRTMPRSSKRLRTSAKRSARPPTRIVVKRPAARRGRS